MQSIKAVLKNVNSIPFPLTIKHYYPFEESTAFLKDEELNSSDSWDALRKNHPHFSISENREEWLKAAELQVKKDGQDGGMIKRAHEVAKIIDKLGITSLFSAGVGGAGLEYQIKKMRPSIHLTCSEYAPQNVERLKKVFLEANEITLFDMKNDDWSNALKVGVELEKQLCLLYRVDIDLTNDEFQKIFKKMHDAHIENVLIILCGRLTFRGLLNRFFQRLSWKIHSVPFKFAGYLRSLETFPKFWKYFYEAKELEFNGLKGFYLKKVSRSKN